MEAELGRFEAFYASSLQHPILLWLAAGAALVVVLARSGLATSVRRYCIALTLLSLADAWLTSDPVFGIGRLPESLAGGVALFFVLAGDYRYLLLVLAARPGGEIDLRLRILAAAAALTLVVPLVTQAVLSLLPESRSGPRVLFLVYELAFLALALGLLARHPNARRLPWVRGVSRFVALYYGLWAFADALLLASGWDGAHLLRVLPNLLYYGGLIAAIAAFAPAAPGPREPR